MTPQPRLPRSPVQDIDLFLMLFWTVGTLLIFVTNSGATITIDIVELYISQFLFMTFIHVFLSLYVGNFNKNRTITWLSFYGTMSAFCIIVITGYILRFGKINWLFSSIIDKGCVLTATTREEFILILLLLPAILFIADIVAMHCAVWGRGTASKRRFVIFLAAAVVAVVIVSLIAMWLVPVVQETTPPTTEEYQRIPRYIIPPWYMLPLYSMLRSVPGKLTGDILALAALVIPMIWPWARADLLRIGRHKWWWRLCCLVMAASFIGLGYLGSREATEPVVRATQALAVVYFAFFLVPFLLRLRRPVTYTRQ